MFKLIAVLLIVSVLVESQTTQRPCRATNEGCGGVHQDKCCLGQQIKCKYHTPIHPEATGVCQKVCSSEGGICSGFTLDPQVCCSGLKCIMNDSIPDLPGRCKNVTAV